MFLSTISQIGGDIFSKSRILLPGSLNSFKEKNSDIYKLPMTYQCYICANGTMTHKYFGDGGKSSRSTSTVPLVVVVAIAVLHYTGGGDGGVTLLQ